ncbi:MAG: hypothetical protein Q9184_005490 [Pyrenodesmia sp. 2 TL-2023]
MAEFDKQEPIAIIGAACRLPGDVSSLGNLWEMVSNVKTGHGKIPGERWDADLWHHPDLDRKGSISAKGGYFLKQDVSHFDAPFFSTTAKEAAAMDPMKRLLLEVSYESFENAGIPVEKLMNSQTGCYVGCMTNDYEMLSARDIYDVGHTAASALSEAMTANRVSWFFGLQGPSLTLDTACSSSLYALHLACQSLKLRETEMALVAGVNLIINPNTMHQFSAMHMLSPEGISHTFDDRANGYGRGEGIGSLIVKRLSDALRDGDTIRAVIRGTGANADGRTPSITQPSTLAQADLIKRTYEAAGLSQTSTQYFESHGTGTPVGDPIELEAIASSLGAGRSAADLGPLYVGSIKPNVGHTEGCSGLAGVFKALVCLEKGMLVPTYGVERLNPKLKLADWNLALPPNTMKWPTRGQRRVSINSFGFGGANAHAILDDACHYLSERGLVGNHNTTVHEDDDGSDSGISTGSGTPELTEDQNTASLFVFSTKDQAGIQRLTASYAETLQEIGLGKAGRQYLTNLAYTLSERRSHFDFRASFVASTLVELSAQLSKGLSKTKRSSRQDNNLVFVFTGQGAQWPAMGQQLLSNAVFYKSMRTSQNYLQELGCKWDALEELEKSVDSNIDFPEYSQTLCTILQIALVDLLRHWKVTPKASVGHSSAAAYSASYITQADAVKVAYVRGLSSATVTREGAMLATGLSRTEALEYLVQVPPESAVIACINSPLSVTLSGDVEAIDTLERLISASGKFARKLKIKTAYHSPHMRSVAQGYLERIGHISPPINKAANDDDVNQTAMFSSLTGKLVTADELNAEYWVSNMCAPVEFSAAFSALLTHTGQLAGGRGKKVPIRWGGLVEIGPHAALQGPTQQIVAASTSKTAKEAVYMSMVLRGKDATNTALTAAGQLWALGYDVDLLAVNARESGSSVFRHKALTSLPPYPWNHSRTFWHEAYSTRSNRFPSAPRTDLLGVPVDLQNRMEPRWRNHLRIAENPWIEDHKITGTVLYPAAGMLVMAMEGVLQTADSARKVEGFRFREVSFERGLVVTSGDEAAVETRLSLQPHKAIPGHFHFTIFSTTNRNSWSKHCSGTVVLEYTPTGPSKVEGPAVDMAWAQQLEFYKQLSVNNTAKDIDVSTFYDHLETIGMEYGPLFRNVVSLSAIPSLHAAHGAVLIPDTKSSMPANFEFSHVMHPATLDAIFHLLLAAFSGSQSIDEAAVPYSIDDMFIAAEQPQGVGGRFHGYAQLVKMNEGGRETIGDLVVSDEAWLRPKLTVKGFALRQVTSADDATAAMIDAPRKCACVKWSEDVDFIKSGEDVAKLRDAEGIPGDGVLAQLSLWLDRLAHKKTVTEVLLVLDEECDNTHDTLDDVWTHISRRWPLQKITTAATCVTGLSKLRSLVRPLQSESMLELWDVDKDEEPPTAQGAYDVVLVIGNRTVRNQSEPLAKLHKVLSPRGHLVVFQTERSQSANEATPLSMPPVTISTNDSSSLSIQSAASSSVKPETATPSEVFMLLASPASPQISALASLLSTLFTSANIKVHSTTLSSTSMPDLAGKHVISLLEIESPLVYSWSETQFTSFKSLISSASHLLWLTRGSLLQAWAGGVEYAPAQGLLRVLRNEYSFTALPHLDLSVGSDPTSLSTAELVFGVWRASLAEGAEMEYAELDGGIYIPRVVEDAGFDGELQLASGNAKPIRTPVHTTGTALKLASSVEGGDFLWVVDEDATLPLGASQIEVEVEFVSLSAGDASTAGHDEAVSSGLGREAVGVVSRCGEKVKSVVVGQRVAVLQTQACRTHIRQDEALVAAVPAGMLPQEVAALPSAFIAAQYALLEVAGLVRGHKVLLHSAASALGQAAIQISHSVGAEVFALVSSKEEKDVLVDQYGISPTRIFDSTLQTFVTAISQATNGQGVDAVLSSQNSPAVVPSLGTLGDFGSFLDLSIVTPDSPQLNLSSSKHNASIIRINMDRVAQAKPDIIKKHFQRIFHDFCRSGTIRPIWPTVVYSVNDTVQALHAAKAQDHGKTVLSFSKDASVLTLPPPAPELALDKAATYVLAGGLGALGLNIADMMVEHGAMHLVFLSRSGGSKNEEDLESFRRRGVQAEAFKCDVTDATSVKGVFDRLRSEGRMVKGMVQCAMVLEDAIFDNMTHAKWSRAFLPKTHGSRNLLAQLSPADAPFFILLSSITGIIGNTAQANYASGNTFEDALAHYARSHLSIAATSIDVGLVADSSHFTATGGFGELESYLHKYQHGWAGLQTSQEELRVVLKAVMRGSTANGQKVPAQLVLGLGDRLVREPGSAGFKRDRKFELRVVSSEGKAGEGQENGVSVSERLGAVTTIGEASTVVEDSLKGHIAVDTGIDVDEVDGQKPLPEFGVDSLKAVEMRNRIQREMQSDVSVFELLSATPLTDLAIKIAERSELVHLDTMDQGDS